MGGPDLGAASIRSRLRIDQSSQSARSRRTNALPVTPDWVLLDEVEVGDGETLRIEVSRRSGHGGVISADAFRLLRRS